MWVRNYSTVPKWPPATVNQPTGPLSYTCDLPNGRKIKCHQDQLLFGALHGSAVSSGLTHEEPSSKELPGKVGSANNIKKAYGLWNISLLRCSNRVRRPVVKLDLQVFF